MMIYCRRGLGLLSYTCYLFKSKGCFTDRRNFSQRKKKIKFLTIIQRQKVLIVELSFNNSKFFLAKFRKSVRQPSKSQISQMHERAVIMLREWNKKIL